MSKYYTPTIEEFHIGFEFESNYVLFNKTLGSDNWEKVTMTSEDFEWFPSAYKNDAYETEFRVKYLDDSDIEELGFKYKAKTIDLWFEKEGIYLREDGHHLNNIKLQYGLHDNKLKITFCYVSGEEQIHFEGKIKNKSELIKLLKMLEIN